MKLLPDAVLLAAVAVVVLGPTLGFNLSPEKLLEILSNVAVALIRFLTKFLEGYQ